MSELSHLFSAFGLSSAAGLNAYIPLLTVAIMANRGALHLASPFDVLGSGWCIALLIVLLIVELVVDKVPGADHVNDVIHTAIRPAAAAILFAANAGLIHGVHPAVWIVAGLVCGGAVHGAKALARPVVNVATVGVGAPVVSAVENLVSTVLAIVAVLLPVAAAFLVLLFAFLLFKMFRRLFGRTRPIPVRAVLVPDAHAHTLHHPDRPWAGGV